MPEDRRFAKKPPHSAQKAGRGHAPRGGTTPGGSRDLTARRIALETLLDFERSDAYVSIALDKRLSASRLSQRDRAFVTRLVYGTVENRIRLDWLIDHCLTGEKDLEPVLRSILRLGCYQLTMMSRVPDMAAVDESVSLTRAMGLEAFTGLTNAVLRRIIREKESIPWPDSTEDPVRYLSVVYSCPEELCSLLSDSLGAHDTMELLRYRPQEHWVSIRVNQERSSEERLERLLTEEGVRWERGLPAGMYRVYGGGDLTALRGYENGLFTIQGESSVIAARMVGAKPGQIVLDACAAPGGKSAALAEERLGSGRVYSWDKHPHRVALIKALASRLHIENIRPMVKDATVSRPEMNGALDAALVDAPCSGTGVLYEKPDLKYRITKAGVEELVSVQKSILEATAPMIRSGGTLVYSTCSLLKAENEDQIKSFLVRHPEYRISSVKDDLPEKLQPYEGEFGISILPHRDGMEGFYICRMIRA